MTDWELAQVHLANRVGGKVSPGSGNGRIKGDVVTDWGVFEVKQTNQEVLTISKRWFNKIKKEAGDKDPYIVFYFDLRPYLYVLEKGIKHSENTSWKTRSVKEDNLPLYLYTAENERWQLTELTRIWDL